MRIKIQSSQDSFRDLRESRSYYIDKTKVIQEYLEEYFEKAVMFTRPRRFGKSLTMTMFRDFLDIRQDSKSIFDGLKIMEYTDVVKDYMSRAFYVAEREADVLSRVMEKLDPEIKKFM